MDDLQSIVRAFPEALFSKKLIVCEGNTEYGICNALDEILFQKQNIPMFLYGCIPIKAGGGSNIFKYSKELRKLNFSVLAFCDTDVDTDNDKKEELKMLGVKVCDCEEGNCIEKQLFKDLPFEAVIQLIEYTIKNKFQTETSFINTMNSKYHIADFTNWRTLDNSDVRAAYGNEAASQSWYKSETGGRKLGEIISAQINNINSKSHLKKQLNILTNWVTSEVE